MSTELAFRARKILFATITEYIATGEPVGSRTLSRRFGLQLSPASIRNVLADLEEAGFLAQPHTSAGRIPTERGFRVFVEALAQQREVTQEDREAITSRLRSLRPGVDDVAKETGRLLSALTGTAAIVAPRRAAEEPLAQLRFVPLRADAVLAVIVTRSGNVQNRVVPVARELQSGELERVHNYLAELIEGRTLVEIRDALEEAMAGERGRYDELRTRTREMLDATLPATHERPDVHIEGQGLLLDRPELADVEKLRGVVHAFEEKEHLLELLDRTLDSSGVQVLIGSEAQLGGPELSMVSASYKNAGTPTGTVGIIGPTRMDYGKVVPLVGFTARVIGEILDAPRSRESEPE